MMEKKILGYLISGMFDGKFINEFVLDASQIYLLDIHERHFHLVEQCIKLAGAEHDSISFPDRSFAVEIVLDEIDTPRFVCLRGLQAGNRFYSRYDGEDMHEVCRTNDGKISYEIIGFADSTVAAQRVLYYRVAYPSFAVQRIASKLDNREVHAGHCCMTHGCKYGDNWCPVFHGQVQQEYEVQECCREAELMAKEQQ